MAHDVKMITCGTAEDIEKTPVCCPIINKILYDPTKIRKYITEHSKAVFIILVLNLFDQTIDFILTTIGTADNIIAIFMYGNHMLNLVNRPINLFHLAESLNTCQLTLCAIRFYELASQTLYASGDNASAYVLEQKSLGLKQWLSINDQVNACNVLLIPLNTSDDNLYHFQQQLIELCNDLCSDFEPRVCTIYDYIPKDQFQSTMPKVERHFAKQHSITICSLLKTLAPIRIYIIGNDTCISNEWSELMIQNESNDIQHTEFQYNQQCTFVENEPINPENLQNLITRYDSLKRFDRLTPIRLSYIREDMYFLTALDHGHITLESREMIANVQLRLWATDYNEHSVDYSSQFCAIDQPHNTSPGPFDGQADDLNNIIQLNYLSISSMDTSSITP